MSPPTAPNPSFLFPLRLLILLCGMSIFALLLVLSKLSASRAYRRKLGELAIHVVNQAFLFSFCAVITEHGSVPKREPGQIYVANHTTVVDIVVLIHRQLFGLTGQAHGGTIGFFQKYVLDLVDNLWFDR